MTIKEKPQPTTRETAIDMIKQVATHEYVHIGVNEGASAKCCQKCGLNWFSYTTSKKDSYCYMSVTIPVVFTEVTSLNIFICPNTPKGYIPKKLK